MRDETSKKHKRLTLDERTGIQECLNRQMTFKAVGRLLGKGQTTISKEVKRHIGVRDDGVAHPGANGRPAAREICPLLLKAPFVCNPCAKRHARCKHAKQSCHGKTAQKEYEALPVESREGLPPNKEAFCEMDAVLPKALKSGQHLYHIMQANDIGIPKPAAYRHLRRGHLSASPLDFPRVAKSKARKPKAEAYVPKAAKIGRAYSGFLAYIEENGIAAWVETDTAIGRIGEFGNVRAIEDGAGGEKETSLYFCGPYKSSQKPHVEKNRTLFRDIVPKGPSFDGFTQETVDLVFSHVNGVKRKSPGGKSPYEVFVFAYGETAAKALGIAHIAPELVVQSPKLLKNK